MMAAMLFKNIYVYVSKVYFFHFRALEPLVNFEIVFPQISSVMRSIVSTTTIIITINVGVIIIITIIIIVAKELHCIELMAQLSGVQFA